MHYQWLKWGIWEGGRLLLRKDVKCKVKSGGTQWDNILRRWWMSTNARQKVVVASRQYSEEVVNINKIMSK